MESSKLEPFWEDSSGGAHGHGHTSHSHSQLLAYERNLNFSTVAVDDNEYGYPKKKTVRDPLSHRIIEKRRRDRMNNCLADLARLLPPSSLRKGRGRIEKTEIVELAIKHLRHLQCHPCPHSDNCEYNQIPIPRSSGSSLQKASSSSSSTSSGGNGNGGGGNPEEHFRLGFQESLSETMHFLVEHEGMYAGDDLCVRLVKHLNKHCENLQRDQLWNNRKLTMGFNSIQGPFKKEDGSMSSGYQPNGSSGSSSEGLTNDGDMGTGFGAKIFPLPPHSAGSLPSGATDNMSTYDYEGDQNSCSSAQLSIEISDAFSTDGKSTGRPMVKPPIPTIICSHSSSNNRYKFKNKIKQRFEDLQTEKTEEGDRKGRVSQYDMSQHGDSNSPDFQVHSPEAVGDREKSGQQLKEDSQRKNGPHIDTGSEDVPMKSLGKAPNSERKCDDPVEDQSVSMNGNSSDEKEEEKDKMDNLVDEKPSLMDLEDTKIGPMPVISSMAGLEDAKALAVRGGKVVPAFALHDKGFFYVPLTIDKSMVPIMSTLDGTNHPPLHPVTISVCFLLSPDSNKSSEGGSPAALLPPVPSTTIPRPLPPASPLSFSQPPSTSHHENVRETNNFILNRFAQSQAPMMFAHQGRSGSGNNNNGSTSTFKSDPGRYPFSICGSTGSGSISSHHGGSMGSTSEAAVKLYHHINNSPESVTSATSNYYSRTSGRVTSAGTPENSSSLVPQQLSDSGSSCGSSTRNRKRSVSISPSTSIGYHSWHEKSEGDLPLHPSGPLSHHNSGGIILHALNVTENRHVPSRRHSAHNQPHHSQIPHTLYPDSMDTSEVVLRRTEKREREDPFFSGSSSTKRGRKSRSEVESFSSSRHSVSST